MHASNTTWRKEFDHVWVGHFLKIFNPYTYSNCDSSTCMDWIFSTKWPTGFQSSSTTSRWSPSRSARHTANSLYVVIIPVDIIQMVRHLWCLQEGDTAQQQLIDAHRRCFLMTSKTPTLGKTNELHKFNTGCESPKEIQQTSNPVPARSSKSYFVSLVSSDEEDEVCKTRSHWYRDSYNFWTRDSPVLRS